VGFDERKAYENYDICSVARIGILSMYVKVYPIPQI